MKYLVKRKSPDSGRRVNYLTDAALALCTEHAADGFHVASIAAKFGIPNRTFTDMRARQPAIDEALQAGRLHYFDKLMRKLNQHLNVDSDEPANITALIFTLRSMFGLQGDKLPNHMTVNVTNNNTQNVFAKLPSPEQVAKETAKLIAQKQSEWDVQNGQPLIAAEVTNEQ